MNFRQLLFQLIQIAVFFAFPYIWGLIMRFLPWWPIDPQTTLGIVISLVVWVVSSLLGVLGIRRVYNKLKVEGLKV